MNYKRTHLAKLFRKVFLCMMCIVYMQSSITIFASSNIRLDKENLNVDINYDESTEEISKDELGNHGELDNQDDESGKGEKTHWSVALLFFIFICGFIDVVFLNKSSKMSGVSKKIKNRVNSSNDNKHEDATHEDSNNNG